MPLLPLEPFILPESLLDTSPSEQGQWWVLHTKPRTEKSLARRLLKRQVGFFLPLYHRQWRSGGRLRQAFLPLFPSYLFLNGDEHHRLIALETNFVVRSIQVQDQVQLESDLKRVYQLMKTGSPLSPEERLRPGTRVEIISGPLCGLEGTILRRGKNLRFQVEIRFLQQGVSVEIDSTAFRPLTMKSSA